MTVQDKLRKYAEELRRKPIPLSELIPLLQQAADELDSKDELLDWVYHDLAGEDW